MEASLFGAYKLFVTEHPGIKVSRRNFECKDQNILDSKRMEKDWRVHARIIPESSEQFAVTQ